MAYAQRITSRNLGLSSSHSRRSIEILNLLIGVSWLTGSAASGRLER